MFLIRNGINQRRYQETRYETATAEEACLQKMGNSHNKEDHMIFKLFFWAIVGLIIYVAHYKSGRKLGGSIRRFMGNFRSGSYSSGIASHFVEEKNINLLNKDLPGNISYEASPNPIDTHDCHS